MGNLENFRYVYLVSGVVGLVSTIAASIWWLREFFDRNQKTRGLNYRREHGKFDIGEYISGKRSPKVYDRQENSGRNPENFDKKILYVHSLNMDYSHR